MEQFHHERRTSLHQYMQSKSNPTNFMEQLYIPQGPSITNSPFQQTQPHIYNSPHRATTKLHCIHQGLTKSSHSIPLRHNKQKNKEEIYLSSLTNIKLDLALSLIRKILQQLSEMKIISESLKNMTNFSLAKCYLNPDNNLGIEQMMIEKQVGSMKWKSGCGGEWKNTKENSYIRNNKEVNSSLQSDIVKRVVEQIRNICDGFQDFYGFYMRVKKKCECGFKYALSLISSYCLCSKIQPIQNIYQVIQASSFKHKSNTNIINEQRNLSKNSSISNPMVTFGLRETLTTKNIKQTPSNACFQRRKAKTIMPNQPSLRQTDKILPYSFQPRTTVANSRKNISFFNVLILAQKSTKSLRNSIGQSNPSQFLSLRITHQFDLKLNNNKATVHPSGSHSNLKFSGQVKQSNASTSWKTTQNLLDRHDRQKDLAEFGIEFKSIDSKKQFGESSNKLITFRKNQNCDSLSEKSMQQVQSQYESSSELQKQVSPTPVEQKLGANKSLSSSIAYQRDQMQKQKQTIIIKNKWNFDNFLQKNTELSKSFIQVQSGEKQKLREKQRKQRMGELSEEVTTTLGKMARILTQSVMSQGKNGRESRSEIA